MQLSSHLRKIISRPEKSELVSHYASLKKQKSEQFNSFNHSSVFDDDIFPVLNRCPRISQSISSRNFLLSNSEERKTPIDLSVRAPRKLPIKDKELSPKKRNKKHPLYKVKISQRKVQIDECLSKMKKPKIVKV